MRTRRNLPRLFWQSLGLIAVPAAVLIGLETYQTAAILPELAQSQAAVAHTFQVIDSARTLNTAVKDAERSQRGFIITGDAQYLEPYTAAIKAIPARLEELKALTEDNPEQKSRLQQIERQVTIKLGELQRGLDARRNDGFDAAQRIVQTNVGSEAMRIISDLVGATISAEYNLLTDRQARLTEAQRGSIIVSIVAGVAALVIIGAGLLLLVVNLNRVATARAATAESEEQFRLLVEGVRDYAIFMLDSAGHVATWNAGAERIKGYTADEIIGSHYSRFYRTEDARAGIPERHLQTAALEGSFEEEGWRVRKDGSQFLANALITALHGPDGALRGFAKVTRDISERREQQEALAQSRAELAQAQKMEAVGQLTGGVAHDFNNLLTAIQGGIELASRRSAEAYPELTRILAPARNAAERGAALINRLLAFSRQQPLAPREIDINRHVGDMSELLRRTLGERIGVETVLAGGLWRCSVDPNQLESALLNLAVNARDAMPDGGKMTIETGNTYLDEEYAAAHEEVAAGQYVLIAISDTGTGMTAETMARALEPFFTTKEPGRGTGLGLSQVYGFVKQSGGHIKLYSEFGHGTTVKIYMPRYVAPTTAERVVERPAAAIATGSGETVLLVEDDADVREFAAAALVQLGYRVLEAAAADEAMDLLAAHPEIAVLLTDVVLPGRNGRELADDARRRMPTLKVIYTTGYARNAIVHHGVLDAGVDLLAKPFTTDGLGRKLQEVMRRA